MSDENAITACAPTDHELVFRAPTTPRPGKVLITFDIDGTLIKFGGESAFRTLSDEELRLRGSSQFAIDSPSHC
jgi:hypothetical protein